MPLDNYYVIHHGITDAQTGGTRTEPDNYDDGYNRSETEKRIIELLSEAINGSPFAEIVITVSGNQGHIIRFGMAENDYDVEE